MKPYTLLFLICVFIQSSFAVENQDATSSISPEAQHILRSMSDYLRNMNQMIIHAEIQEDSMAENGQKLQFQRKVEAIVQRPNKFRATNTGYKGQREFYYDGETISILLNEEGLYAQSKFPGTIDAALDHVMETFGVQLPLTDFIVEDPYQSLTGSVQESYYVGKDFVGDIRCHHLAFRMAVADWQLWVEDGPQLVPRKLLIDYKTQPGQPQFTAVFTGWDKDKPVSDMTFEFSPPDEATQVEFLPRHQNRKKEGQP